MTITSMSDEISLYEKDPFAIYEEMKNWKFYSWPFISYRSYKSFLE